MSTRRVINGRTYVLKKFKFGGKEFRIESRQIMKRIKYCLVDEDRKYRWSDYYDSVEELISSNLFTEPVKHERAYIII